jgi:hypothetical protein
VTAAGYLVTGRDAVYMAEAMISTSHYANWLESRPARPDAEDGSATTAHVMVPGDREQEFLALIRKLNGLPRILGVPRTRMLTVEKIYHSGGHERYELLIGEPGTGWDV